VLATRPFWGRRAALTVVNTALAFPTVVVGLLLYGLLSRRGPLGGVAWLYTWQAIVVGDVVLAFPIAAALAAAAVQGVDPRIRRTAETLGAGRWRTAWTVAREARFALAAVITTAFGHVVAEIGSAMTVGATSAARPAPSPPRSRFTRARATSGSRSRSDSSSCCSLCS